jgi:hypothetical protein
MTRGRPTASRCALLWIALLSLAGCDRGAPAGADSALPAASTVQATPPGGAPSESVSSQTRGTSPPPNDGTLPRGTEGSTGSRRGGGKS